MIEEIDFLELDRERISRMAAQEQLEQYKAECARLQSLVDQLAGERAILRRQVKSWTADALRLAAEVAKCQESKP